MLKAVEVLTDAAAQMRVIATALDEVIKSLDPDAVIQAPAVEEKKEAPKVTLEELRMVLARKAGEGFKEEIRKLILDAGAHRLSEVPKEKYGELKEKAEAMTHGS